LPTKAEPLSNHGITGDGGWKQEKEFTLPVPGKTNPKIEAFKESPETPRGF